MCLICGSCKSPGCAASTHASVSSSAPTEALQASTREEVLLLSYFISPRCPAASLCEPLRNHRTTTQDYHVWQLYQPRRVTFGGIAVRKLCRDVVQDVIKATHPGGAVLALPG